MEDIEKVTERIEAEKEMIEKLGTAFNELESHREASLPNKAQWTDIKEHLDNLEKSLQEKINEVEEKERAYEKKQSESRKLIAERETAIAAKEFALLDRLQELKDAAVSAVLEARKNCKEPSPILVDVEGSEENIKVSISATEEPTTPTPPDENPPCNKLAEACEVKLRPQLKEVCEKMDAKGLLKILSDNRKHLNAINEELSAALESAAEPARLVLDSLESFYPLHSSDSQDDKNALQVLRRTCLVTLEAAAPLLVVAEPGNDHPVSSEIKQQAKVFADEWKAKLAGVDIDASNGYSLEAVAFLQLLVTFSIAKEFHEDELCKLILAISGRRQAPELCRSLGLVHRMPGVVETLVKTGKQINAVHFVHAFGLAGSFPIVPLLKEYLNNVKGSTTDNSGDAATSGGLKDSREMSALRVVIRCIEDYKLQQEFPVDPLKKRLGQLEKAKYDKKRMGQAAKTQPKKPRFNGGYVFRKPVVPVDNRQALPPVYGERATYPGIAERYSNRYAYAAPAYEVASRSPYGQQPTPYGNLTMSYGTGSYGMTNYGNYEGSGYQSTPNSFGGYTGSGVQSVSTNPTNHGTYMGAGGQPSHQSYI